MMKPFIGLGIKNRASGMLRGVYASNNRTTSLNLHNGKTSFPMACLEGQFDVV